jgi:phasin family protein
MQHDPGEDFHVMNTQKHTASVQPPRSSNTKAVPMEATEKLVPIAVDPIARAASAMSETVKTTVDRVAAVAEEVVEPVAPAKTTTIKPLLGMNTMIKSTEDFVALGQANMEALVKSGQIWTAGVQELMKQFAETAKASFDESVATLKAISSAKSVTEAMYLQSKFATSVAGRALAESNKLVDASIKLTEQTLAPITARVSSTVTFGKAA